MAVSRITFTSKILNSGLTNIKIKSAVSVVIGFGQHRTVDCCAQDSKRKHGPLRITLKTATRDVNRLSCC